MKKRKPEKIIWTLLHKMESTESGCLPQLTFATKKQAKEYLEETDDKSGIILGPFKYLLGDTK